MGCGLVEVALDHLEEAWLSRIFLVCTEEATRHESWEPPAEDICQHVPGEDIIYF